MITFDSLRHIRDMNTLTDIEWAWLAGLFEGEGSIGFVGANSVSLAINMNDEDVVQQCKILTGIGNWFVDTANRANPLYRWYVAKANEAEWLLQGMKPYFGKRRTAKANAALERLSNCQRPGFCKRNHAMTKENTYVSPRGQRQCRICNKIRQGQRRAIKL